MRITFEYNKDERNLVVSCINKLIWIIPYPESDLEKKIKYEEKTTLTNIFTFALEKRGEKIFHRIYQ